MGRDSDCSRVPGGGEAMVDWEKDARNPLNWPAWKKWTAVLASCVATCIVGLNSTVTATLTDALAAEFSIANDDFEYAYFAVTAWNTAAALVPLATLPLMEAYGMRPGYLVSYGLFTIFLIPQALAPNFATIIVSRVFAGAFGGTVQNAIDGIIANIFRDEKDRALPLAIYIFSLLAGVTLGPVQGAIMGTNGGPGWRWAFWMELILCGAMAPVVFLLIPETRGEVLRESLYAVSDVSGEECHEPTHHSKLQETVKTIAATSTQAVQMLFTSPVLASFTLLSSFAFGLVFAAADSVPLVMGDVFGFNGVVCGVTQVALFIGEAIGLAMALLQNQVYLRSARQNSSLGDDDNERGARANNQGYGTPVPETILYASIVAIPLLLSGGLFIYGFTAEYAHEAGISWPVPVLGLLFQGIAVQVVITAVSIYITDFYPLRAASAIAAVAAGENIMASYLPLGIRPMYLRLGYGWASALLGFIGLALGLAPVALVWKGAEMRRKSS